MKVSSEYTRNPWVWVGIGGTLLLSVLAVLGRSRLSQQPVLKSTGHRLRIVTKEATSTMDRVRDGIARFVSTVVSVTLWTAALGGVILLVYAPRSSQRHELWGRVSSSYEQARRLASEAQQAVTHLQNNRS
ncbi:MAG: hypothetical protein EPO21_23965 [Chloroflexota bacterium]|nr:MAG: hypothetical protein EPO21_23965 [Chloroflexota bacterium]